MQWFFVCEVLGSWIKRSVKQAIALPLFNSRTEWVICALAGTWSSLLWQFVALFYVASAPLFFSVLSFLDLAPINALLKHNSGCLNFGEHRETAVGDPEEEEDDHDSHERIWVDPLSNVSVRRVNSLLFAPCHAWGLSARHKESQQGGEGFHHLLQSWSMLCKWACNIN